MTNWIQAYGGTVRKYQAGGPMGAPAGPEAAAPAPAGGDMEGMLMEYAETRDPQLAVAIADALVEMLAAQAGGGAPAGGPAAPPGAPMGRFGRKMRRGPVLKK